MRIKSEIWVKAYIRTCMGADAFAGVVRRGDVDAGVILIKISRLDGRADLFGPAPAGYSDAEGDGERRWMNWLENVPEADVEARLEQERRLDSDVWIVEVESRSGRHFLDGWLATP